MGIWQVPGNGFIASPEKHLPDNLAKGMLTLPDLHSTHNCRIIIDLSVVIGGNPDATHVTLSHAATTYP